MSKVYITDYIKLPDIENAVLGDALGKKSNNAEIILVWHKKIDQQFIDQHPKLKCIIRYGVGYDNIDINYANKRNIIVCNTPDYGTAEVSDTAIAMILNIARAVSRYDYRCRQYSENWQENTLQTLRRLSEYRLGVIGAGRIGGSVILKANAMGFKTSMYDPYQPGGYEKTLLTQRHSTLEELLASCDLISIHCPLSEETHGLVSADFIRQMKNGASIINTARGQIVSDIDIFYQPLKSGKISNVALDVLPIEPPDDSLLLTAWRARENWLDGRLLINPHSAYYSQDSYKEMRTKAAENALSFLNGNKPVNIVNNLSA